MQTCSGVGHRLLTTAGACAWVCGPEGWKCGPHWPVPQPGSPIVLEIAEIPKALIRFSPRIHAIRTFPVSACTSASSVRLSQEPKQPIWAEPQEGVARLVSQLHRLSLADGTSRQNSTGYQWAPKESYSGRSGSIPDAVLGLNMRLSFRMRATTQLGPRSPSSYESARAGSVARERGLPVSCCPRLGSGLIRSPNAPPSGWPTCTGRDDS